MARTKTKHICKYCNKVFYATPCLHQKYCSYGCAMEDRIGKPRPHGQTNFGNPNKKETKICKICKKKFISYKTQNRMCCSYKCSGIYRSGKDDTKKTKYTCPQCGKTFTDYITNPRRYCSRSCLAKSKTGEKAPNWHSGKKIDEKGYILIYAPYHPFAAKGGGSTHYIREHRLVMEKHIGRYLKPEEVVHHINYDKTDNRIENLQLFANHSKHMIHCKAHKHHK